LNPRLRAGLLAGGLVIVAGLGLWAVQRLLSHRPPPPPEPEPSAAAARPLSGEVADAVLPLVIARLSECAGSVEPACRASGRLELRIVFTGRGGRIERWAAGSGCLSEPARQCFERTLAGLRLEPVGRPGSIEIGYPLGCSPDGRLHLPRLTPNRAVPR
jgi:hypothetical protein